MLELFKLPFGVLDVHLMRKVSDWLLRNISDKNVSNPVRFLSATFLYAMYAICLLFCVLIPAFAVLLLTSKNYLFGILFVLLTPVFIYGTAHQKKDIDNAFNTFRAN